MGNIGIYNMKKTDNYFVIHNFNTDPSKLIDMCNDYIVYDCSTDIKVKQILADKNMNVIDVDNTGHNISSYFHFFSENYDRLPQMMCLMKGNMIGRHCSEEFFQRVYDNKFFTYLYEDKNVITKQNVNFLAMENMYCEINNSWYVTSNQHPHKYFDDFNRLLRFVYKTPVIPEYCLFSPGACYIVSKEQILMHSRAFYKNLNKIMTYGMNPSFPSEAHQIERMLPVIFSANYEENEWMNDECEFEYRLQEEKKITQKKDDARDLRGIHRIFYKLDMKRNNPEC